MTIVSVLRDLSVCGEQDVTRGYNIDDNVLKVKVTITPERATQS